MTLTILGVVFNFFFCFSICFVIPTLFLRSYGTVPQHAYAVDVGVGFGITRRLQQRCVAVLNAFGSKNDLEKKAIVLNTL